MENIPYTEMDLRTTATHSLANSKSSLHRIEPGDMEERFCFTCRRPVHPYLRITLPDKVYHPDCAKCYVCQIDLSLSNYRDFDGKLYCPPHYSQALAEFIDYRQKNLASNPQRASSVGYNNRLSQVESPVFINAQAWPPNYRGSAAIDEPSSRTIYVERALPQHTDENVSVITNTIVDSPRIPPRPRQTTSMYAETIQPVHTKMQSTQNGRAQTTNSCVVCSKPLLPTTYINLGGKSIHLDCLRCETCGVRLKQSNLKELDGKIYCTSDYNKLTERKNPTVQYDQVKLKSTPNSPSSSRRVPTDKTVCFACGKKVYATESLYVMERVYHKSCFKCMKCNGNLSVENYHVLNGQPYCKSHYRELIYNSGNELNRGHPYIVQADAPIAAQYETPLNLMNVESVPCQICQNVVLPRDGIQISHYYYHYDCFTCTHCKKKLNIGRFEMVQGKAYCTEDFLRLFGRNRGTLSRQPLTNLNELPQNRAYEINRSYSYRKSRQLTSG